jgi:predicted TIM-barrel fold metal-dependent hydrolase
MIIDSHVHLCGPPYTPDNLVVNYPEGRAKTFPLTREMFHPDSLIRDMKESGTDKAVVMAIPDAISNDQLHDITKKHQGKLIGFAGVVDPKNPESVKILEKAVKTQGMKGLKLHPDFQSFSPSDQEIVPLLSKAAELDVPVLFHCTPGAYRKGYFGKTKPEHYDSLKASVPEAKIIIAHMAWPRYLDLLTIAKTPGVYAETSFGLGPIAQLNGLEYTAKYLRMIGVENVLYGSDWNGSLFSQHMKDSVRLIYKLPLTDEEREMILEQNITQLLKL